VAELVFDNGVISTAAALICQTVIQLGSSDDRFTQLQQTINLVTAPRHHQGLRVPINHPPSSGGMLMLPEDTTETIMWARFGAIRVVTLRPLYLIFLRLIS
jgi:hypothetical protein